jgi:hypothetical protein
VAPQAAQAGAGPNKLALLVGINQYEDPDIRALRGALNDVDAVKDVLIGKFGFDEKNVLSLRNEQAKGDSIRAAFRTHLIDGVKGKQDVVVFYYSGHGSQVLDEPDGDESDGLDETLVPYDSTSCRPRLHGRVSGKGLGLRRSVHRRDRCSFERALHLYGGASSSLGENG